MTEIGVLSAGRDNEIIEGNTAAFGYHLFGGDFDIGHFRQEHFDVALAAKNAADWRGDVSRRELCGRDLVKQWLKQVIVVTIDHCDVERGVREAFRRRQAGESSADDHHALSLLGAGGHDAMRLSRLESIVRLGSENSITMFASSRSMRLASRSKSGVTILPDSTAEDMV
jgi:hypothetical protein